MCCPKWWWSRRRPAALPQCISSNVHLRFKHLLFGGCTSGSMRGFGCESRTMRWVAVCSLKTVWTYGMCRSEWRVWLETYHGALVIDLRSLDWYRWMTAMLDLVAHPHSSIPYVHTGVPHEHCFLVFMVVPCMLIILNPFCPTNAHTNCSKICWTIETF